MRQLATPDATPAPKGPKRAYPPRQEKPAKDFPLFWHARGYWCKKIDGRQVPYTADWRESLKLWEADDEARRRGQVLPSLAPTVRYTVQDGCDLLMDQQKRRFLEGKIEDVQLAKYRREMEHFAGSVGAHTPLNRLASDEGPALFELARGKAVARGLEVAEQHIGYVRKMLALAHKRGMMPEPRYLDSFEKPDAKQRAKVKLKDVAEHGARAWSVPELRLIVKHAWGYSEREFALVLLGLNGGFGADDAALLRDNMIDRERGMILGAYRGKTMRQRAVPLWTVTLWAIDRARAVRPAPKDPAHADRLFLTRKGQLVARKTVKLDADGDVKRTGRVDAAAQAFDKVLEAVEAAEKVKVRKHKTGFYTLRAMFRTLATGTGIDNDLIAVIKGQRFQRPVDEYYLRGDLREKLVAVTDHVFNQLFGGWSEPWPR